MRLCRIAAVLTNKELPGAGGNDSGIGLTGGVRGRPVPKVEFDAGLDYTDVAGANTSLYAAGRYALSARLAAGGGVELDNGHAVLSASIRGDFGGFRGVRVTVPPRLERLPGRR